MKKLLLFMIFSSMLLSLSGCGKTKILHCDACNKEVEVSESSNMEEEWTVFCDECEKEIEEELDVDL